MAISTIGGSGTTGASSSGPSWVSIGAANSYYGVSATLPIGLYRVRAYATGMQSTPIATVIFFTSAGVEVTRAVTVDNVSGDTFNFSEMLVLISASTVAKYSVTSSAIGYVSIENTGASVPATLISPVTYTTSQTVTIPANASCVLIGGGGGGGGGAGTAGGGGSGYIQRFSIAAGSYPLVVGAGGGSNTSGSASTFNGLTAAGGGGASGGTPGAGGSGGGTSAGAAGGFNGSTPSGGGAGSGVQLPYWLVSGSGGNFGGSAPGGGGGFYAGGGGSTGGSGGGAPGGTGPGGGGGGAASFSGGAGASGALYVAVGA